MLEIPGFDGMQDEAILLPPQPDLPELEVLPVPLDPELLQVPDMPPIQTPRLQAPVLAVVAADFKPKPDSETESEVLHGLPDLKYEDYQPLEPSPSAPWLPLAPLTRWWPALRLFTPLREAGPDLPRLVGEFARCRPARRLPRLRRRGRYRRLLVVRDWRKCMIPFGQDFEQMIGRLRRQQQAEVLEDVSCHGFPPAVPHDVDAVLVLSDLGLCASSEPAATAELWAAWARELRARGVAVEAWVPVSAQRIPAILAKAMPCIPWHERSRFRPTHGQRGVLKPCSERREAWMCRLWPLLAISQRIEPALLRRARLLASGEGQPEWEATVWDSSEQHAAGEAFLQLRPSHAPAWRERFAHLSPAVQRQVWQMLVTQHASLPRSTLVVEQLIWGAHVNLDLHEHALRDAVGKAHEWLTRMSAQELRHGVGCPKSLSEDRSLHSSFLHGLVQRNAADFRFTGAYAECYASLAVSVGRFGQGDVSAEVWAQVAWKMAQEDTSRWSLILHHIPNRQVFEQCFWPVNTEIAFHPKMTRTLVRMGDRRAAIWQPQGQQPVFLQPLQAAEPGDLFFRDETGTYNLKFSHLHRAPWQHVLGQDCYGVFCEMLLRGLSIRFRYISPGTFRQRFPHDVHHVDGRRQQLIVITHGFWLAETVCTQALWELVMGSNPSHFKYCADAPMRPVENVSWDDVQLFLEALQPMFSPGYQVVLPTDSEWEYACRAGAQTNYWWGDAPDSAHANWNNNLNGTTPVGEYACNPWGLFDVHGNVWEWCSDGPREHNDNFLRNNMGDNLNAFRVVRGGSWMDSPVKAVSDFRYWRSMGHHFRDRGFRIAIKFSGNLNIVPERISVPLNGGFKNREADIASLIVDFYDEIFPAGDSEGRGVN